MRPINPSARRGSPLTLLFGLLASVIVAGGGIVGTLWALGVPLPWLSSRPVTVLIPANARPIAAYAAVTREDLINVEKKALHFIELRPEQVVGWSLAAEGADGKEIETVVSSTIIRDGQLFFVAPDKTEYHAAQAVKLQGGLMRATDILGRVVARDKLPGTGFREEHFLPKGTRSGISAGIPPGMQALTLDAGRIGGVHGLKAGDHIDLVATIPEEHLPRFGGSDASRLPGASLILSTTPAPKEKKAGEARLLAEDAVLVTPVMTRTEPQRTSSLTQGAQVRNMPVQEIVLAVQRDDVPGLSEAMALSIDLTCIARSGRPDGQPPEQAPEGLIAVAVGARPVAALSQIVRDDIFHPRTRRQKLIYLTPEEIAAKRIVMSFTDLVGRVAAHDLLPGHFITEDDLLPPGTPPGLAAGVPPGKRAFVVQTEKFHGLAALRAGDHFDLLASATVDLSKAGGRGGQNLYGSGVSLLAALPKQADVRVLVRDGVIVAPIIDPQRGRPGDGPEINDVVVAVDPVEVPAVAEALATGVELTVVARSAQGTAPAEVQKPRVDEQIPEHHPLESVKALEVVVGGKRETVLFLGGERVVLDPPVTDESGSASGPTEKSDE
ncbi:MAG TPA: hypothetical protein VMP01_03320 [Pirellulaceae bacterium]|nr:hypothetical protein [Pirellulaceae bacterium]